mmetsp:Transcript_11859/g.28353  ORF Transcript_11859/g.28353 Transcript_11859/m.28353 type:complete len:310 (+) Transcript_11859:773-1702(+)
MRKPDVPSVFSLWSSVTSHAAAIVAFVTKSTGMRSSVVCSWPSTTGQRPRLEKRATAEAPLRFSIQPGSGSEKALTMMLGRTMPTAVFPRCRSSIVSPSAFENVYVFWCVPIHSGVFFVISSGVMVLSCSRSTSGSMLTLGSSSRTLVPDGFQLPTYAVDMWMYVMGFLHLLARSRIRMGPLVLVFMMMSTRSVKLMLAAQLMMMSTFSVIIVKSSAESPIPSVLMSPPTACNFSAMNVSQSGFAPVRRRSRAREGAISVLNRSIGVLSFFARAMTNILFNSGASRNSLSRTHLPTNPEAPIMRTDFPA